MTPIIAYETLGRMRCSKMDELMDVWKMDRCYGWVEERMDGSMDTICMSIEIPSCDSIV